MARHGRELTDGLLVRVAIAALGTCSRMAKLTSRKRRRMSAKTFALPGKRKYPIPDKAHARNALARVAQHGTAAERKQVRAKVTRKYPSLRNG